VPPRRTVFWLLGCLTFVVSLTIHEFAEAAVSAPDDPRASPPWSQQEPETPATPQELAETVTVTATRFPTPVADVGSSVSVITAEQIRTAGAHWLPDVLGSVPGVTIVRSGPPGTLTSAFLRGAPSRHTLVLIDGLKVTSPATGDYNLALLPIGQIERVEVLRGPQSTLYGSDAISGVINIISRANTARQQIGLQVEAGSFGTVRAEGTLRGTQAGFGYSVGLSVHDADGFSAADTGADGEADGFHNVAVNAQLSHRWNPDNELRGFLTYLNGETEIDDFRFGVGPVDDPNDLQSAEDVYAGLRLDHRAENWTSQLTLSTSELTLETSNPDGDFFKGFLLDASLREVDWQNEVRIGSEHSVVGGVEARQERARSTSVSVLGESGFEEEVGFFGLYAKDRFSIGDRVHIIAGGRLERHQKFGNHATYQLAVSAILGEHLRAHGSVGSGFRAPNFNQLFFPDFGNPELRPEESVGIDLGLDGNWLNGNVTADLTLYRNWINNLIEFGLAGFDNIGEVTTRGVEASASWSPSTTLGLTASYTLTDAEEATTGEQLVRRPRHQGAVAVRLRPTDRLSLFTELRAKGRRFDIGPSGRLALDSFVLWNMAAQIEIVDGLQLIARADNLLGEDYQEVVGFGTAGASGYVGFRWDWSR